MDISTFEKNIKEDHKVHETFLYYDVPLIYSFYQEDSIFLAYFYNCPEDKTTSDWVYLLSSEKEVEELKNNKITLYNFLNKKRDLKVVCTVNRQGKLLKTLPFDKEININKDVFLID